MFDLVWTIIGCECVTLGACTQVPLLLVYVHIRRLVDSILEAVLTVSPNRQYLGILYPTIPATHGPIEQGVQMFKII